jgi:hypothetical protein
MTLTDEDHELLKSIADLTAEALVALREFEERHGLDITGPAIEALTRADVSLEFVPRQIVSPDQSDGAELPESRQPASGLKTSPATA